MKQHNTANKKQYTVLEISLMYGFTRKHTYSVTMGFVWIMEVTEVPTIRCCCFSNIVYVTFMYVARGIGQAPLMHMNLLCKYTYMHASPKILMFCGVPYFK